MLKNYLLICVMIIVMITTANATNFGGLVGFGRYWRSSYGLSGFAVSAYADFELASNVNLAPTINFWTGKEDDVSISDLAPAVALKYSFKSGIQSIIPFIGIEPKFHILFGYGESHNYFGLSGLGGIAIPVAPNIYVPVQGSFGLLFGEEGYNVNVFTAKVGILGKF